MIKIYKFKGQGGLKKLEKVLDKRRIYQNKNLPIEGMVIVEGLKLNGKTWEEGTILDPKSGKIYSCYITFDDDNTLKVRGYIGFSLLGRTQKWIRKN